MGRWRSVGHRVLHTTLALDALERGRLGGRLRTRTPTRIVMIHPGRTGSSVVADLLRQQSSLRWDGEVVTRLRDGRLHPSLAQKGFWGAIDVRLALSSKPAYGFELKPLHLGRGGPQDWSDAVAGLQARDYRHVVLLRRENVLRRLLSVLRLREHQIVGARAGSAHPGAPVIDLDVDDVLGDGRDLPTWIANDLRAFDRIPEDLRAGALELVYEQDVLDDPSTAARRVLEHVGLPFEPAIVRLRRIAPARAVDQVSRPDALRGALAGTPWEWMIDDER